MIAGLFRHLTVDRPKKGEFEFKEVKKKLDWLRCKILPVTAKSTISIKPEWQPKTQLVNPRGLVIGSGCPADVLVG